MKLMRLIPYRSSVIAVAPLAAALLLPLGALAGVTPGTYNWVPEGPIPGGTYPDAGGTGVLVVTDAAGDLGSGSYFSVDGDTFNLTAYDPSVNANGANEVYILYSTPFSYPSATDGNELGMSGYAPQPGYPNVDQAFWDFQTPSLTQIFGGVGEWVLAGSVSTPSVPDPCSTLAMLGFSAAALNFAARRIKPVVS
jgi:hypothetical protein